jgi:DNA topoisomerase-1
MARLRRVTPASPGWTRRRVGRGFTYLDAGGERLPAEEAERIASLAIPPAWTDVWICPYPNGHLQAVGTDAAGRRQYLYHPVWRAKRDAMKFDRVMEAAEHLPDARRQVMTHLVLDGMPPERASAVAFRLLDLGAFRIGNDVYADTNGSFGLTTLERRHVRHHRGRLVFRFTGKSGVEHRVELEDPHVLPALDRMRRRRGGSARLLAYQEGRRWRDLDSSAVNSYLGEVLAGQLTAKDFRTWHATVLAATLLATTEEKGTTKASRRRAVLAAVDEVAASLGNTRAVARSSYIDPRVIDLYEEGVTIAEALRRPYEDPEEQREAIERAVLRMLR